MQKRWKATSSYDSFNLTQSSWPKFQPAFWLDSKTPPTWLRHEMCWCHPGQGTNLENKEEDEGGSCWENVSGSRSHSVPVEMPRLLERSCGASITFQMQRLQWLWRFLGNESLRQAPEAISAAAVRGHHRAPRSEVNGRHAGHLALKKRKKKEKRPHNLGFVFNCHHLAF